MDATEEIAHVDAAPDVVDASPDAGSRVVDTSTMSQKLLMGYQGWFMCPPSTCERHFKWMRDHDLDGVLLQRFTSELSDPNFKAARDQVLRNVMSGAEKYGRVFAIEYDISGQNPATLVSTLENDWAYLVGTMKVTQSPRYLRHTRRARAFPWGFGFSDRPGTPQQAAHHHGIFWSGSASDGNTKTMPSDQPVRICELGVHVSFTSLKRSMRSLFRCPAAKSSLPDGLSAIEMGVLACVLLTSVRVSSASILKR
jgi:hypothetical protein